MLLIFEIPLPKDAHESPFKYFFTLYEYHKLTVMTSKGTIPVHLSTFVSIETKLRACVFRMQHVESTRDNSEYVFLVRSCANGLSIVMAFLSNLVIAYWLQSPDSHLRTSKCTCGPE